MATPMGTPTCILLADDFTGACDTALQFVRAGLSARVQVAGVPAGDVDVLVWDTQTRNHPAAVARDRVADAVVRLEPFLDRLWYKKVDSTLRGAIGAEVEIVLRRTRRDLCVLAPALPDAGRTTLAGTHFVDGIALHRSPAGQDPGAPVLHSSITDLLASTASLRSTVVPLSLVHAGAEPLHAALARLAGPVVAIVDAQASSDLRTIAAAAARLDPPPLLCGSAGLAAFVPEAFGLRSQAPRPQAGTSRGGMLLILAGSATRHTRQQLDHLHQHQHQHWAVQEILVAATDDADGIAARAMAGSTAGSIVAILSVPPDEPDPDAALRIMARAARCCTRDPMLSGIAVTGRTTAIILLDELSAGAVNVLESVEAQVPLCRLVDGPAAGLHLITKAGGLGGEDVFVRAARRLLPS
ncbi:MAG: hypothetical protein O2782_21290 [bacterium]|nr:hypothetical protein [bacterium]